MSDRQHTTEHGRSEHSDKPNVIDWTCFSYLTAERAELYRAIIDVFAEAKSEFSLHLRGGEVRTALARRGITVDADDVESALGQLESWGNLQSYQDNADVSSLTEYYRKRLLYQMSAAGEAAHDSTLTFAERLNQAANLDARALERIVAGSGQLNRLIQQMRGGTSIDAAIALTTIRNVCQDADELTSRAQSFFRWLHEQTESEQGDLQAFLTYKEQLIDYLQQFVGELILHSEEISDYLSTVSESECHTLAGIVAAEDVGPPVVGTESEHHSRVGKAIERWRQRIVGLCGWFVRKQGKSPQADQLRAAARSAIPRLLQLASRMNERESGRSDRVTDLKTLAVRFLECRDDGQAHQLYRAAFSLSPARHLRVDSATLLHRDQHPAHTQTSWADADPVIIQPQLRATGRSPKAASNRRVTDRSKDRAALKRRLSPDAGRDEASREKLVALGRCRLSDIGGLDRDTLALLVHLLERSAERPGMRATESSPVYARTKDGILSIRVWNEPTSVDFPFAPIESDDGTLVLKDQCIEVQRAR